MLLLAIVGRCTKCFMNLTSTHCVCVLSSWNGNHPPEKPKPTTDRLANIADLWWWVKNNVVGDI